MFVLFQRAEEDAHAFLGAEEAEELKKLWSVLFLHYPQCSESQREDEEVVDGKTEEQRRRAIEGVVDITRLCLMEMNQEDLADADNRSDICCVCSSSVTVINNSADPTECCRVFSP